MNKVVIIGGGTAGWISAIFAKKRISDSVAVITSPSIDILGAGEGSTPNMFSFFKELGIDIKDFLLKTDATLKTGIEFIGWGEDENQSFDHLFNFSGKQKYGFHFNARKTADYLENYAKGIGIKKIEKTISGFEENSIGDIKKIFFEENQEMECDFILDCSGFQRILIGKHYGSEWKSYSNNLVCNKAFGFFLPQEYNLNGDSETKTKAVSMNSGWMWQIPLRNRWGCGYVFNDEFTSIEEAILETERKIGSKIEIQKVFNFIPGIYKKTWINNCISLGLSSGFIEPLEATSIMSLIASLSKLSSYEILEARESEIVEYNDYVLSLSDQIVNFLVNHYKCDRKDTDFWRYINKMDIPGPLKKIKSYHNLDDNKIKEAFGINTKEPIVFGDKSYRVVDLGHRGNKRNHTLI